MGQFMCTVEQVNSYEDVPQFWKEAKIIKEITLQNVVGGADIWVVTFERTLSEKEQKINHIWGVIDATLYKIMGWKSETTDNLPNDTKETKTYRIVLEEQIQGKRVLIPENGSPV
jgi:hypothetical protein